MKKFTVVGGGIVGASLAYHLQKEGHQVTVYDRKNEGQATEASAGIICPWVSQRRNKKWYRLVTEAAKYYPEFIRTLEAETKMETGYKQNGTLCLFRDDDIIEKAYKRISSKQTDSPEMGNVKKITREENKTFNTLMTTQFPAVYVEGGGQVNGGLLKEALKHAFINYGGTWLYESFDIDNFEDLDESLNPIIYTTGAWGVKQNETFDFKPKIRHQRAMIYHFEVESDTKMKDSPVILALGPIYIVEMGENQYAIGTTHENTESFEVVKSEENYKYLRSLAETYFPHATIKDIDYFMGLKPYTRDHLPYIGQVREHVYVINGLGATGLTASPVIGRDFAKFLSDKDYVLNFNDFNHIEETYN